MHFWLNLAKIRPIIIMIENNLPDYLIQKPLHEILSRREFSSRVDVVMSYELARDELLKKYPDFKFDGLDKDSVVSMASLKKVLDRQSKKVINLISEGKNKEAHILAREIKLIGDPNISIAETGIGSAIVTAGGDFKMAVSLLGFKFKDIQNGTNWIEFIVRTWGFTPKEIVELK